MSKFFYAVRIGRNPGIYNTWAECEREVRGFAGAAYKKFNSYEEALNFNNNKSENIVKEKNKDKSEEANVIDIESIDLNEAIAYVDGSFDLANWTYSYGVVFITKDNIEKFSGRENNKDLAEMRNVSGEIKGAMVAMEVALQKGIKTLYLHFDYIGIKEWGEGHWKTNKDGTKFYKAYVDSIKDRLNIVFVKVKAHSGVEYNEEADRLAKEAIM